MRNLRWLLATTAATALLSSTSGVCATGAANNDANNDRLGLEEIVVTAQKRQETAQELPGVISALQGERIKDLGVSNIDNLASQISGMTTYSQAGSNFVTLRGVGVPVDTGVSDSNVSITVDGVVLPRQTEAGLDSPDLQRVEVLRGPQGTLYGRNATGGAINYISAPPTDTFTGMVSSNLGNYETWGVNGFVSGPLSDRLRIRLSAAHDERNEGYLRNVYTGGTLDRLDRTSVRGALSANLTDNVTADVSVFWQRERFDAYQTLLPPGLVVPNAPPQPFGNLATLGLVQGRDYTTKPFQIASDYNPSSQRQTVLVVGKLNWSITDDISLSSLSGYVDHRFTSGLDGDATSYSYDYIPDSGSVIRRQPSHSVSEELNLSGKIPRGGSWIIGAYYFHEDVTFNLPVIISSQISPVIAPGTIIGGGFTQATESAAIFGDVTVPVTEALRVFGGVRYGNENLHGQALAQEYNPTGLFRPALVPLLPRLFNLPPRNPTALSCPSTPFQLASTQPGYPSQPRFSQDHKPFTPRLGAQYDVTDNVMVYAQYSRGFKAGGHSTTRCDNNFAPESLTSYEAGIKAQFFAKRLTFDASAFHYDYRNMQIFKFENTGGSSVENAGAEIDGVDVTVEALLGDHYRLDLATTWLDDRFTDFCSTDPSWPTLARPCPKGTGFGQNLKGGRLPNAPDFTVNIGLDAVYPVALGPFQDLTIRGEGRVVGPTQLDAYGNRPEIVRRQTYGMINATVTLATADGLQVRAVGRNLANQAVISHLIWTSNFTGQYLPPRTFGVEVRKRF